MPELVIKKLDKEFLLRLLTEQSAGDVQVPDLIHRFHPRSTSHPNTLFASLSEAELEIIVDALGDVLVSSGLNQNDEPNGLGYRIESYIDIFSEPMHS